jgi:hypothetical protein
VDPEIQDAHSKEQDVIWWSLIHLFIHPADMYQVPNIHRTLCYISARDTLVTKEQGFAFKEAHNILGECITALTISVT